MWVTFYNVNFKNVTFGAGHNGKIMGVQIVNKTCPCRNSRLNAHYKADVLSHAKARVIQYKLNLPPYNTMRLGYCKPIAGLI